MEYALAAFHAALDQRLKAEAHQTAPAGPVGNVGSPVRRIRTQIAMAALDQTTNVQELDAEEGRSLLDRQARRYLDMSGDEFARAWEAGEFADRDDTAFVRVAMLLPFGR